MRIPDTPRRALWSLLWQRAQIRLRGLAFQEREPSLIADAELTKIDVCWAAGCGLTFSDAIRGADFQSRSLLLALRCGEPFRVARALAVEAGHVSSDGPRSWRRADRLIRAAEEQARRSGHPHALGVTLMAKGGIAHLQGRWAASITHSDEAEAMLRERCTGVAWELNAAHSFALWSMAHAGRVADLGQRRQALLNEAFERGDRHAVTTLSCITLDRLAADDAEGALGEMRDALSEWRYPGFHVQHCHALNESIDGYLYLGDPESARSYLEERWPLYSASLLQRVQRFRVDTHYSRSRLLLALAARSANPHQQLRSALSDARRLDREGVAWARALAFLLRAGAAAILGQTARAVTLLMDAAKHLDAVEHATACRRGPPPPWRAHRRRRRNRADRRGRCLDVEPGHPAPSAVDDDVPAWPSRLISTGKSSTGSCTKRMRRFPGGTLAYCATPDHRHFALSDERRPADGMRAARRTLRRQDGGWNR